MSAEWTVEAGKGGILANVVCGSDVIALLPRTMGDFEPGGGLAKAHLIAAAPTLFRALAVAVAVAKDRHLRSREAAARHNNLDGVGQKFDYVSPDPLPEWVADAEVALSKAKGLR